MRVPSWLPLALLGMLGCGRGAKHHGPALAPGFYSVDPPVCDSTGQAPAYPTAGHKVALFDFDDLTEHTVQLETFRLTETFRDADCLVTSVRGVFQNASNRFSRRLGRAYTFEPPDCELSATAGGVTYAVSPKTSPLLQNSGDDAEELPFDVAGTPAEYTLRSADEPDLDGLWAAYGCAAADHLKVVWRRL